MPVKVSEFLSTSFVGFTGSRGSVGFTGSQGSQGIQGLQGAQGFTGSAGAGFTGSQGVIGFTGSAGASGSVSVTNDTTTNADRFVTFASASSGTLSSINTASTKLLFNPSTGQLSATEFNSLSDQTYKEDIKIVSNALDTINSIDGVEFIWKDTGRKSFGVTAQQVEQIIPELVKTGDFKTVNYNSIIAFLIEAVKELNRKIDQNGNSK